MRECAPLEGPANAGEKSEKSCERWKYRTRRQNVRNDCKTEKHCAQRHSKVSESDGCPSVMPAAWARAAVRQLPIF
ncbi:MAG: hypothetical protein WCV67_19155 [Victivallaceae bacterium]